jgi:hypothetical protein
VQLAARLTATSRKKFWDVYTAFDWPDQLEVGAWCMSPELISIYGTEEYEALDQEQQKRLSLFEVGNFFSLVLQGERPLVQGLVHRLYLGKTGAECTDYLHHFVDEENKHMIMFGEFCRRYIGKIYPEKKIALPREYAKGEEDVAFFCKVLVVEELGDYYNVALMRDERVEPFVREINRVHHVDEARHLAFGRQYTAELYAEHSKAWSDEVLDRFREWLVQYIRSCWGDYYNPAMYRDAGLPGAYELRTLGLSHPACAESRRRASAKLVSFFLEQGILVEEPAL